MSGRPVSVVFARLESFWFGSIAVLPMAVARILLGCVLFSAYAWLLPWYDAVVAPGGLLGARFLADVPGPTVGRVTTENVRWLQTVPEGTVIAVMYVALLVASLAFAVGYRTRIAGVIALGLHLAFHGRNEFVFWGWADMLTPFVLYVVLAPSGRLLSLDARRARRGITAHPATDEPHLMPAWPLRLLQVHVSLVYVVAAWSRLDNPHWLDGSMLSRILADGTFSRAPVLAEAPALVLTVATYAAWAVELAAPLSLWQPATRRWIVPALIALHLGLEVMTRVGWWNVVMLAGLTAFMPVSWLETAVAMPVRARSVWREATRSAASQRRGVGDNP